MQIKIKYDDEHTLDVLDEVGMTFMTLLVDRLNQALLAKGMQDESSREEVCGEFLFGLAYDLDASWFEQSGIRYFPKMVFLERVSPKEDENLGEVKTIHLPTQVSSWHEYAFGVVSEYFGELDQAKPDVVTGSYNLVDE